MIVAPSILTVSKDNLKETILKLLDAGTDWIHWDVMDGKFVPNISFNAQDIKNVREDALIPFDVHLMIENPELYIEDYVNSGADYITFHYEATSNPKMVIDLIKSYHKKVGISIKPKTPVSVLTPYLHEIDLVLIMSVEPGFGGQKFMESALDKIRELYCDKMVNKRNYVIEVDGGINDETSILVADVGCEVVVSGTYIINNPDIPNCIKKLQLL